MTDPDFHGGHYYEKGVVPVRGPAHRAHDRPHHLPVGRRDDGEVRPRAARASAPGFDFDVDFEIESYLRYQGDKFADLLRRQHLPAHHQGARLLRPGGRTSAATCRRRSRARRPISSSSRSPPTGASRRRARARSCERCWTTGAWSPTSRSTRRRATTPSCSTTRATSARCAPTSATSRCDRDSKRHHRALGRAGRPRARPGLRRRQAAQAPVADAAGAGLRRRDRRRQGARVPAATTSTCCRWTWRTASPRSPTVPSTA